MPGASLLPGSAAGLAAGLDGVPRIPTGLANGFFCGFVASRVVRALGVPGTSLLPGWEAGLAAELDGVPEIAICAITAGAVAADINKSDKLPRIRRFI